MNTRSRVNALQAVRRSEMTYHSEGCRPSLTDPRCAITEHLQYLPFGEEFIYQKSNSASITAVHTFSGKEFDQESGYSYFGARYYESNLSIWLSVDPLSDKYPSHSPYNYCMNNPVMLVDPDGRSVENIEDATNNPGGDPPVTGQVIFGVKIKINDDGTGKIQPFVNLKFESELYENKNTKGTFAGGLEISLTDITLNAGGQVKKSSDDGLFGLKLDFTASYNIKNGTFGAVGKGFLEIKNKFGKLGEVNVENKPEKIYLNSATNQFGGKFEVKKGFSAFVQSKISSMPEMPFPSFAAGGNNTLGVSYSFRKNRITFTSTQESSGAYKFKKFP